MVSKLAARGARGGAHVGALCVRLGDGNGGMPRCDTWIITALLRMAYNGNEGILQREYGAVRRIPSRMHPKCGLAVQ